MGKNIHLQVIMSYKARTVERKEPQHSYVAGSPQSKPSGNYEHEAGPHKTESSSQV